MSLRVVVVFAAVAVAFPQFAAAQDAPPLRRWFEIDFASLGTRYRMIENSAGHVTNNHLQHRQQFRGRFKFDAQGHYTIHAGLFTGSNFIGSWNNTGLGTGSPAANLRLKQLFAAAVPLDGVQFQIGSIYPNRGESTEITTYDEDGYLMGERVQVTRPAALWFDEIAFTNAQLAYAGEPSVSHRWDGLSKPNYRQLLLRKRLGPVAASADFTAVGGARLVRGAAAVSLAKANLRFEGYRRMRDRAAGGVAITAERTVSRWLRVAGGYATIDPSYGGLNADRFDWGRRLFTTTTVTFTPWLNLSVFATRAVANELPLANRTRVDTVLTCNLLPALRRTRLF